MEIALIVIAFVINPLLGLAVLAWRVWRNTGSPRSKAEFCSIARSWGLMSDRPSADARHENTAFEDYKKETLDRLEREREKLREDERAFDGFLRELRRAKDKEEFDRFMHEREEGREKGEPA